MWVLLLAACPSPPAPPPAVRPALPAEDPRTMSAREEMVARQLKARDIRDPAVLAAMRAVPRHLFMPETSWPWAYQDSPAPIGQGQTISQPYIVARMTQAAALRPGMRALEVGTGSGYQAAVLSELGVEVYTIEIIPELAAWARGALRNAGYPVDADGGATGAHRGRIHLRVGDGYAGWPEAAPFDAVLVTAAPDHVPAPLRAQLAVGGRMVLPVGDDERQELLLVRREADGYSEERLLSVMFVPMTGEARQRPERP